MIFDLFSKRQKRLKGDIPDIYTYDNIPNALRVQIVHIWYDVLGNGKDYFGYHTEVKSAYKFIVDTICREYGLFYLPSHNKYNDRMYLDELANYFLSEKDIEKTIDIIELSFKIINHDTTKNYNYLGRHNGSELIENAINELNNRFKEHGVGFQFVENEIIRIDSELIHNEAVKPTLKLLNQKNYQGAQEEFLSEHYRHGKNKEALNDCLKAFESTMKSICDKHSWQYKENATAKVLIQICFDNNLIPSFWQTQITALRSMLESSVPTGRNKLSGHGQGTDTTKIPNYLVAYMLHMTASTLVFLTTAEKDIK